MRLLRVLFALCLCLLLFSCCVRQQDVFAPFRGGYVAEVTGELYGMAFSADIEMAASSGTGMRAATVTFYAPDVLSGTTVRRTADGEITVSSGGLTLSDAGGIGASLFSLFPVSGEITESTLTAEGYTRLVGENFVLTLLPSGVPYAIETESVSVTVVRWESK